MPFPGHRKTTTVDAYFRFLNLLRAIQDLPSIPHLDAAEARLLDMLASAWHAGRSLTVTEAMALESVGAPATIHRRLTRLRMKGLIELHGRPDDSRVKTIVPSESAQAYFDEVARCLKKASRG